MNNGERMSELAEREGWPSMTLRYRGYEVTVRLPVGLFDDPPAIAEFMKRSLVYLTDEAERHA